ncbi:MAG: glycosyltransferase family 2 protein [Nitrospira sp.]|nr:glycosyltransferase family 2 protein [Nitrospira sp.]
MSGAETVPVVSICIPAYNGYPYISLLIDELLASSRSDFEVVVSDDCSKDQTWEYLQTVSDRDSRLKCFRNTANLGMDGNFARAVSLARGEYVWLCGQDDIIFHEGIEAVAELLRVEREIDFVYLNDTKIQEGDGDPRSIQPIIGAAHVCGVGLADFLRHTKAVLPTFLPTYIMKKAMWDGVSVDRYFGTAYCQVGVFLEASDGMRWCHFDGSFVVGLLPQNGWQVSPINYVKISFGYYVMLGRAMTRCVTIDGEMVAALYYKRWKMLLYSIILLRSYNLAVSREILDELMAAIRPFGLISGVATVLLRAPAAFCNMLLQMVIGRRILRSISASGVSR